MSGYHRISKLKSCLSSLNLKNLKKLNDNLGMKIDSSCSKSKDTQDSAGYFRKIKEVNEVLTKEFNKVTGDVKIKSNGVLNVMNDSVTNCKNKLRDGCKPLSTRPDTINEKKLKYRHKKLNDNLGKKINSLYSKSKEMLDSNGYFGKIKENVTNCRNILKDGCKPLYTLPDIMEEKELQYRHKHLKTRQIRREAEKLCQYLSKHQIYGKTLARGAVGLSLTEVPSDIAAKTETLMESIPEPPAIPDVSVEALNQLNALGEPTFASLGLGGWTPVGMVQQCMEYVHATLGLEWWAAIVLGTLVIRICLFPLVILSQRNAAKMNNFMPQMQLFQMKLSEARQMGDSINAARYSQEMMMFMNEKGLSPLKNMIVPLCQAPIFVSFFMGLRQMANVPVESLRSGGLFWFTDLTLPDQYLILPIITSATLWLTVELGTDAAKLSSQNMVLMKYGLRALPLIILPFTVNFPGVILCYWVASNFISLGQVAFLRIPKVRAYFNIDPMLTHKPEDLPVKPKGFREGLKDSWTNIKITKELEDRRRLDEIQFQRAGKGPIQKTYKIDPTQQINIGAKAPISAKKR